ncbi:hypothetical protein [Luteolibacter sp. Populi]|uniref:hypothetical protein n=1 Tax=Luteolibacter sp. Populi TaxID=3230487 RepID=UPI0034656494
MSHFRFRMVPLPRIAVAAFAALALPAIAGTYNNDFNASDPFLESSPTTKLTVFSNQAFGNVNRPSWLPTGGVDNSGYLKLTNAVSTLRQTIVFPDFEPGFHVAGFDFAIDCRVGGGGTAPADGFSLNFARAGDTVITTGTPYAGALGTNGHNEADRHEEGTATGLSIAFDAYFSGTVGVSDDVVGISVRVDNQVIAHYAAPVINPVDPNNPNSLQTGPRLADPATAQQRIDALGWGTFEAKLDRDTQILNVWWKGVKVIDELPTNFVPGPGRLVFGVRTGGNNQVHHFDNMELTTYPVELATVTSAKVSHQEGYVFQISDYETSSVVVPGGVTSLLIDTDIVTPTSVSKTGSVTTVTYVPEVPLPAHANIFFEINAQDQLGTPVTLSGTLVTPVFPLASFIADAPTLNQWNIRTIRGGTIAGPTQINTALAIAANPALTIANSTAPYFNISDDASFGARGFFKRDAGIANGVTGNEDNIVTLGKTKISITEPGDYTFWVQSDDGFALRIKGAAFHKVVGLGLIDPSDASTIAYFFGTGNANTRGVVTLAAGEYEIDHLWFEGTSDSYAEVAWAPGDHADDTTTGKWSLVGGAGDTPFFPAAPLAEPVTVPGSWAVRNYYAGGNLAGLRDAFTRIATPGASTVVNATVPVINFRDPFLPGGGGADGIFRNNTGFPLEAVVTPPVDDNHFVTIARYEWVVANPGDYTFAVTSDDGFALRVLGGPYIINNAGPTNNSSGVDPLDSTTFLNSGANDAASFGVYRVAAAGTYTIEVVQVEQSGGSSLEVAWAPGNITSRNATSTWMLLGNPNDPSVPVAAPILPVDLFATLPKAPATQWSTRFYHSATNLTNIPTAIAAINNPATPKFTGVYSFLNFRNSVPEGQTDPVPWTSGLFHATHATAVYRDPAERQFLGATGLVDHVAALATARVNITTAGNYTFGISSDDGFAFRIVNAPTPFIRVSGTATIDSAQPNTVYRLDGSNNARAVINLPVGQYDLEFAYYEGTGNAHFELYAVAGDITNDADSTAWRIVGHTTSGGLPLVAQPVLTPPSIGSISINAQTGAFSFSWNSQEGTNYKIQYSDNLAVWHDLNPAYPGQAGPTSTYTGNVSDLTLIPGTAKVFFRLEPN